MTGFVTLALLGGCLSFLAFLWFEGALLRHIAAKTPYKQTGLMPPAESMNFWRRWYWSYLKAAAKDPSWERRCMKYGRLIRIGAVSNLSDSERISKLESRVNKLEEKIQ